jgi:amino acid adenylation domain-containing protein
MVNGVVGRGLGSATLVDLLRSRAQSRPGDLAYTFLSEAGTEIAALTYAELDDRARALGAELQRMNATGERALLLFPPGLDFIVAFLGCLYAGVVAVPAYPPRAKRVQSRLRSIARDSQPCVVLTVAQIHSRSEELLHQVPELAGAAWVAVEQVSADPADSWQPVPPHKESLAFLQYTSGSTSSPKGVMVTHGNLVHNEEMIRRAFGQSESSVIVGWLPLYHDMGLIGNVLQPLYLGARCVLMSPLTFLQKPLRWLEAISRYGGTTSGGPNFAYDLCVRKILPEEESGLDLSRWNVAFNGAEPVRPETMERFFNRFGPNGFRREAFYPCYGLAEATLFVTGPQRETSPDVLTVSAAGIEEHRITSAEEGDPRGRRFVSCGHAWMDQEVAIVEPESGRICPAGQVGEIWISGESVAAGYWRQPEATELFFKAQLPDRPETFLRTGDLGFLQDGGLFITGRLKDLIIIRGRNLYPQDLELTAERSHPSVRPGCSAAFSVTTGVDGEERLVLACEVERRPEPDPVAVSAAIRGALSEEYEVQIHDVVLLRAGTIPKTSSGKIQRHACRAGYLDGGLEVIASSPLAEAADLEAEPEPIGIDRNVLQWLPGDERRDALTSYLRSVLAELIRVPASRLDLDQPVTNLGLDSLGAVGLTHRLETDLAVSVPLAELFQGPTLTELVDEVLERLRQAPSATQTGTAAPEAASGPLSDGQRAIWFLQSLAPESAAYNIAVAGHLEAGWDTAALRRALEAAVERHPALRTSFGIEAGEPVQRVREAGGVEIFEEDADGWSDEALSARLHELAYRPFDLEKDRLMRWAVFRRTGSEAGFLLVVHHIVADLWSLVVLLRDLEALYLQGSALVPPPSLSPLAHAVRQRERIEGPEGERLWLYWSRRLAGELPASAVPTDRPRPPVQTFAGSSSRLHLSAELLSGLQGIGRGHGSTLYVTLLAAFQALLFRYSGQEDQLVGSPTAGRDRADLSGVIGYFVNPVVLRSDLSGDPGFSELLKRVRGTVLEAFEHQDYPFPRLVERLQPERDPSRSPLFQVMFVLQASRLLGAEGLSAFALGEEGGRMELAGLSVRSAWLEHRAAQFDLELIAAETGDGLGMSLLFNTDLFDAGTADRLLQHLATLLRGAIADPAARLSALPLLTAAERSQMLTAWNDTARAFPLDQTFQQLFEAQAARTPGSVAAAEEGDRVTYRELNRRANRLARFLLERGVAPEERVSVLSERGLDLLTAMLGIFKAGAVYVPLDPLHPRTRILQTVEQSASRLVLVADALRPILPEGGISWRPLSLEAAAAALLPDEDLGVRAFPQSLAYVIYTSGSTGTPKGAMVEQRGMVNHLWAKIADLELTSEDRIAQTASQCFDISVWQFLAALLVGGQTRIFGDAVAQDPARLLAEVEAAGVTVLETVPSMLRATLEAGSGPALAALRWMIPTGEALAPDLCGLWLARYPSIPLVNAYGPTECSDDITHAFLRAPLPPGAAQAPIGRPVPNLRLYVLDRGLEPVPVGVPGELYAGGAGVGRGYLGDPARTAEVFVPDLFAQEPGLRLYRTGDLGRWREDGQLEFLGRVDHQVKIRGFRIELGEIEALLAESPAVRQAVVLALPDSRGDRRLVAYVATDPEIALGAGALRELAQERLPEYMVPSAFVLLPELPLTANGKIDRRALPEPDWVGEGTKDLSAPRTPMEELIAGIWAEVLGLERVGVDSSFFELGGHSLLATQVVSRIRGALDVEIPLRALFELPGVARLAELVESTRETARPEAPPLRRVPRTDVPLSFAQQRLWFLHQLDPASPAYNMPGMVRLSGPLDAEALAGSLAEMVRRHESLRTVFPASLGEPRQEILPEAPVDLQDFPVTDLSDLEPTAAEERLQALVQEEGRRPFDLQRGPLLRTRLVRLAPEEHALILNLHHIVSDGWSQGVLVREMSRLYEAFAASQPSPLPELPVQYADYAVWQRDWLQGEALDSLLAWWRGQLAGSPGVLDLPVDHPRPPAFTYQGSRHPFRLPARLADRLRAYGRRESMTPFMILLAGFQALLHRHSGQTDLLVGTAIANRQQTELEDLVGFFMNTLALRADLGGRPHFLDLLEQARRTSLGAYAHQGLPFEKLVDELHPERDLSRSPLLQVMLILQNAPMRALQLPGLEVRVEEVDNGTAKLDLTVSLEETDEGIVGWIEYNVDLFDRPTVARLARHFETLIEGALANPEASVEALPLVGAAERFQLLAEWNDTLVPAEPACVHHLFEAQARRTPEAIAVTAGTAGARRLTYADLNSRANRLAHRLRSLGVGAEVRVGLCVDRTPEMVVGLLGILKAGGSYVPLDPSYPEERLAYMLADASTPVVVAEPRTAEALPPHGARMVFLDPDGGFLDESTDDPAPLALPENIAYVIHTSGSTGKPKGVQVPHAALTNFLESMRRRPGLSPDDVLLSVTTLSFDIAGLELFLPLITGASVTLVERSAVSDAARLRGELEASGATVMQATPITWHLLLESGWPGSPDLKVLCGGEALPRDLARALCARAGSVWNLYGPTETTIWSAVSQVGPGSVSIGRPIANTTIHLLDLGGNAVPVGVPGELLIGGSGLARGYLNRPDLTADRFVPAEWGEDGGRLYRTGDLARRLPDGSLEFLGRIDHQIKVRGYRIELQEIEAVLAQHPEVKETVVTVREGSSGVRTAAGFQDRRLVAYVVPASPEAANPAALRAFLRERLPEYMVPAGFILLERLPLTPNGKVDRKALPEPEGEEAGRSLAPPRSAIEEMVAGIWSQILGTAEFGIHDNFFDLGGHSLLVAQVMSRLQAALRVELPLRLLFERPTIATLAETVEALRREGRTLDAPPVERVPRGAPLPLSFAQERLWVMCQLVPDHSVYNVFQALSFEGPLDLGLLERCFAVVIRRHESLRTSLTTEKGHPVQVIAAGVDFRLPVIDLSALPAGLREPAAHALAVQEVRTPFDLASAPLLRVRALRLESRRHVVVVNMHHLICDNWSIGILNQEIAALYGSAVTGAPEGLAALPFQYADFAVWQRKWLNEEALREDLDYWTGRLSGGLPILELPTDRPRPAVQSFRGAVRTFELTAALTQSIESISLREGKTLFMTLLAAFAAVLHRSSGQDDLVIGSPVANREHLETEELIGFFVNILPLRIDLSGEPSYRELLERVQRTALEAYDHQRLSFERVVEALQLKRDLSRAALRQVGFAFQNAADASVALPGGVAAIPIEVDAGISRLDMTLFLWNADGKLRGAWEYSTDLFEAATIDRLMGSFQRTLEDLAAGPERRLLETAEASPGSELTESQLLFWFAEKLQPDVQLYFDRATTTFSVAGELDRKALGAALNALVQASDALRSQIHEIAGVPRRIVCDRLPVELDFIDLSGAPDPEAAFEGWLAERCGRRLDLSRRLFDCALVRLSPERSVWFWNVHHIIADAWSLALTAQHLSRLYLQALQGSLEDAGPLPPYQEYVEFEREKRRTERYQRSKRYWGEKLSQPLNPNLFYRRDAGSSTTRVERVSVDLGGERSDRIRELARRQGFFSGAVVFAATLVAWLHRLSGDTTLRVGTPLANRPERFRQTLGLMMNACPLQIEVADGETLLSLARKVQVETVETSRHQDYPVRNPAEARAYDVYFNFQTVSFLEFCGLPVRFELLHSGHSNDALDLQASDFTAGGSFRLDLDFNVAAFDEAQRARSTGHYLNLLDRLIEDAEQPLGLAPMLSSSELDQLLRDFNDTRRSYPEEPCLHRLIALQAERSPGAVAVVFEGETLTYAELDRRANQLSHFLLSLGVRPDRFVGLCVERSLEMVVGMLGILKAGCAYVPLDPSYPQDRLEYMSRNSACPVLLTQEGLLGHLPPSEARTVCLDRDWHQIAGQPEHDPGVPSAPAPASLAYMIYTSGSTGRPKGAMLPHAGVVNRLLWMQEAYGLTPADRVLQKTPFSFDVSVWELFWPLLTGARLVMALPGGHQDPRYLADTIAKEGITTLHFVPSMLQVFLEQPDLAQACASVKRVFCSGEALPDSVRQRFFERLDAQLHNLYGPTEASVDVTFWECAPDSAPTTVATVPIGRPIANTRIYILDGYGNPSPSEIPGELHIGGVCLARGYLGRPDLTAEKFVPDPFGGEPGARLYRTGDLVRGLPDGNIDFLGRLDFQVKIRGFRIELAEIEAVLMQHSSLSQAIVTAREDRPGDRRLVAYLTAAAGGVAPSFDELRALIRNQLPDYMVPAAFVTLESMPLTPSGKVDRRALPAPGALLEDPDRFVSPRTPLEAFLVGVFADVLGTEQVSVHGDFFDLGGNSLMATQVAAMVQEVLPIEIPLRKLFEARTVAAIAQVIHESTAEMDPEQRDVMAQMLSEMQQLFSPETGEEVSVP